VGDAAARLSWSSVFALNLGVRGGPSARRTAGAVQPPARIQWAYIPERHFPFYRIGCFSNAARAMAPPGHSSIWIEISHNARRPIDRKTARQDALRALAKTGFIRSRRDIVVERPLDIPCAYVTFDAHRARAVATIRRHLARHNIHSIGRYGRWEYSSMEDALLHGRALAEELLED
jgi:phytoene dehydrogenase-like protein